MIRSLAVALVALFATGCGKSGGPASEAVSAPASSGEVWEIDREADRPAMPGAVLAYVNGLHVVVLDGKDAYAGMTRLAAEARPDGGRAFKLPSGLEAVVSQEGPDRLDLKFSTGETVAMRRKR